MFKHLLNNEAPAQIIFDMASQKYSHQVFAKKDEDINACLCSADKVKEGEKNCLTKDDAWLGFKGKGETPEQFVPLSIIKSAIGDKRKTAYGENYTRYSIQHSFVTNNLVIVKEDIHVYEKEKKIVFLGCQVDSKEAETYLKEHFKAEMLSESPKLFHVVHALQGSEDKPIATWKMVRLCEATASDPEEATIINRIKARLERSGLNIYLQTLEMLKGCRLALGIDT